MLHILCPSNAAMVTVYIYYYTLKHTHFSIASDNLNSSSILYPHASASSAFVGMKLQWPFIHIGSYKFPIMMEMAQKKIISQCHHIYKLWTEYFCLIDFKWFSV